MPFFPRRSVFAVPPELMQPAREQRPPIPVPKKAVEDTTEKTTKSTLGLGKLNMQTYEPDQSKIIQALFGNNLLKDPVTGILYVTQKPKE